MNTNDQKQYWKPHTNLWIVLGVCALLIAYPFMDTVQDMMYRWNTKEEYGYGYIIPFVTGFLVWQRVHLLQASPFKPDYNAVYILIVSGVLYFMGTVATTHTLSQYALVLTIMGVAYGVMGKEKFKIIAIPLSLLFLMVPLPPFIYNNLSGKLQLISSELGVAVIRLMGISVYLEGNIIDLGKFKLQVAEACNGLRYLFPLVSLSFIAAYLYKVELWKKIVVFLSSIPITVLMNSFRIGVIGILVEYYGIEQAEGFLHDFEGWVIFMACMGVLFLEMSILAKIGSHKRRLADVFTIDMPDSVVAKNVNNASAVHYVLIGVLSLYSVSTLYIDRRDVVILDRNEFITFPDIINSWQGARTTLEDEILDSLKADDYLLSDYKTDNGEFANLYVAYYKNQEAGAAAHSPRACIPGGGWQIKELKNSSVSNITMAGEPLHVVRLVIQKGDYRQLVYYWFQQRGRIITNEYLVKWYLFWDGLTKNRTDGALVRLTTLVAQGEDIGLADERLRSFLREIEPIMDEYVPL